jgi:endonuclease/exonuclease/phosphatase (EEP) superfamily protein YafD
LTGPVLIAGDFNTNRHADGYRMWFPCLGLVAGGARPGLDVGETGFTRPLRIDVRLSIIGDATRLIFLRKLAARRADIVPMAFSDHHALVAVVSPAGP